MGNDAEAEKARLESELRSLNLVLQHSFFGELRSILKEKRTTLDSVILRAIPQSFGDFAAREQAIGGLQVLCDVEALLDDPGSELKRQIADL